MVLQKYVSLSNRFFLLFYSLVRVLRFGNFRTFETRYFLVKLEEPKGSQSKGIERGRGVSRRL
jgi:hypothetical protein